MTAPLKSQEFEGITVDEAIKTASLAIGVSRENLNIKVVCEEQKGLFGMQGASLAKIKVSKKEKKC
ncbi:MAG: Jag N-terminal domain-containing protein [Candidatus Omnitrophica bacterium]|nr:Jag N-terminal domain-containing protein [Candidatus Omnitrophota bacterium]